MQDENTLKKKMVQADDAFMCQLSQLLRAYDCDTMNMLAWFVADLCDVDVSDMLSSIDKVTFSQARWLFWYTYRYLTKESFARISERTTFDGHSFAWRSIASGITNMSVMIETDNIWRKRWAITKRFINAKNESDNEFINKTSSTPVKVTLTAPKGTKIELKEI